MEWLDDLPSIKKEVTYMRKELGPFRLMPGKWGILLSTDGANITSKVLSSVGSTLRRNYGSEFLFAVRGGHLYAKFIVAAE